MKWGGNISSGSQLIFMQGRLTNLSNNKDLDSFPIENWAKEFSIAKKLNIKSIELVFDRAQNELNPLLSNSGRQKIRQEFILNGLKPFSACLNFIIDNSLADPIVFEKCIEAIKILDQLGVKYAILPLFGESDLTQPYIEAHIEQLGIVASDFGIQILIESNKKASTILGFLRRLHKVDLKVVYDIGNASYCGHRINRELPLLKEYIGHIHIKDKDVRGINVPLGSGIVEFKSFFDLLSKMNYDRMYTLETSRADDASVTAMKNINFINRFI
jgi:sugar phosphate isomerase/epimerase